MSTARIPACVEGVVGAAQVGLTVAGAPVLRHWFNSWGATPDESRCHCPATTWSRTRRWAPRERWLQRHGGPTADDLGHARGGPEDPAAAGTADGASCAAAGSTWQWHLRPTVGGATRLVVRQRLTYPPSLSVLWHGTEPVAFVMERRMLLGIKTRAEASVRPPGATVAAVV